MLSELRPANTPDGRELRELEVRYSECGGGIVKAGGKRDSSELRPANASDEMEAIKLSLSAMESLRGYAKRRNGGMCCRGKKPQ